MAPYLFDLDLSSRQKTAAAIYATPFELTVAGSLAALACSSVVFVDSSYASKVHLHPYHLDPYPYLDLLDLVHLGLDVDVLQALVLMLGVQEKAFAAFFLLWLVALRDAASVGALDSHQAP